MILVSRSLMMAEKSLCAAKASRDCILHMATCVATHDDANNTLYGISAAPLPSMSCGQKWRSLPMWRTCLFWAEDSHSTAHHNMQNLGAIRCAHSLACSLIAATLAFLPTGKAPQDRSLPMPAKKQLPDLCVFSIDEERVVPRRHTGRYTKQMYGR